MLLFTLICLVGATTDPETLIDQCGKGVTFSRAQAIACFLDAIDTNHDGRIVPEEISVVKSTYLKWYEKGILWAFGDGVDTDTIMKNCDLDKDGAITYADMVNSDQVCLPLKNADGSLTGTLCKVKEYICDRASAKLGHNVY